MKDLKSSKSRIKFYFSKLHCILFLKIFFFLEVQSPIRTAQLGPHLRHNNVIKHSEQGEPD